MSAIARIAFVIAALLSSYAPLRAQSTALSLGASVDGVLPAGETHRYSFSALEWTLISLRVEALDEGLDPRLEIFDASNALVIANDDYAYPETRDAALQAFLIPRTGAYTIVVSAFAGAGAYRLHLLPGYDRLALRDDVMSNNNWEVVFSDAIVTLSDSSLFAVEMQAAASSAVILGLHLPLEREIYFEAAFESVAARSSWQVGLVFRYLAPDRFHRLLLSNRGNWIIERVNGDQVTALKGWQTHPAIVPGMSEFRLGVFVSGSHYDVVYNGQVVGTAKESLSPERGGLGLALRTAEYSGGELTFAVREALATTPTRVDEGLIFPQRLLARRYFLMADELTRQQLAPAASAFKLTIGESSARAGRAGVTQVPIAPERQFEQFAFGAAITMNADGAGNGGCGLSFHGVGQDDYTLAYVTRAGDAGLSRRSTAGFAPGIYRRLPEAGGESHYLLVVAQADRIHLFADEEHVGSMDYQPVAGSLGIAVVNYEPVFTACEFGDLWLLGFEG